MFYEHVFKLYIYLNDTIERNGLPLPSDVKRDKLGHSSSTRHSESTGLNKDEF
jgi:hypothetical protein